MSSMDTAVLQGAVETFLDAFTTHRADAVLALCTEDVRFEMPFLGDQALTASNYESTIQQTIPLMEGLRFFDIAVDPLAAPNEAVAQYRGSATISHTGIRYDQKYFSRFRFVDGKVDHFQENFDTALFKAAFGLPIDWRMKVR